MSFCLNCLNHVFYCRCINIHQLIQINQNVHQREVTFLHLINAALNENHYLSNRYYNNNNNTHYKIQQLKEQRSILERKFQNSWVKLTEGTPSCIRFTFYGDENKILSHLLNFENYNIPNNKLYLFHGTPNTCNDLTCGYCSGCSIMKNNFDISYAGRNTSFLRFGKGIYFAPNSSKANDYTRPNGCNIRCAIVCLVNLGNHINKRHSDLTYSPPHGIHSVYGEAHRHGDLNYDEYVVYNNKQVVPFAAIFYRT